LVLALALPTAPAAAARPITAVRPEDPHVLILQRRCIDRILSQAVDKAEDDVISRINQQCMVPRSGKPSTAPGLARLSCEPRYPMRVAPRTKRIAGCLGS
jgi:hypothetical protein